MSTFRTVVAATTFALAPLRDTPINAVKSGIKFLDYGLVRLLGIYSAVEDRRSAAWSAP